MKKLRVLVLMHADLVPPDSLDGLDERRVAEIQTEWDVTSTLRKCGHDVTVLGIYDDLRVLRDTLDELNPHVVFNLLEEFAGQVLFDQNVVSYLELRATPYTGSGPRGLTLARDKALTKKILHYHRIRTPPFIVYPRGKKVHRPNRLAYPLIVKSDVAEASEGISQASIVHDDDALLERVAFIHRRVGTDALVETFVDGRELYVGVLGNERLTVLPPREMVFENMPAGSYKIATRKVKWDPDYQERRGIWTLTSLDLDDTTLDRVNKISRRIYRRLDLCGYARLDFRMTEAGELYLLEVNPNPNIAENEDFALSASVAGFPYSRLLDKIMSLGMRRMKALWS